MTFIDRIGRAVTYAEFLAESGLLAERLSTAGLGPGSRVVLTDERSAGYLTSALGI